MASHVCFEQWGFVSFVSTFNNVIFSIITLFMDVRQH